MKPAPPTPGLRMSEINSPEPFGTATDAFQVELGSGCVVLGDLFDEAELRFALAERLVVARKHPHRALTILNYTERCQYERGWWNAVTMTCRGLIHDAEGRIVARPFRKFFNYGQAEAPEFGVEEPCEVTDKMDGSLGILYGSGDWWEIATRGSFDSGQALHATDLFNSRYVGFRPPEGWTMLFEIVYPDNRIVLDYGDTDDLILLGAVEIASGRSVGPRNPILVEWSGPRADVFPYATVADALAAADRANAEGLVLHLTERGERVKIKQEDYVTLHRIIMGLNERAIWEHLGDGYALPELLEVVPDEFHEWIQAVGGRLEAEAAGTLAEVEATHADIVNGLPVEHTRKEYALVAKESPLAGYLFARLDDKPVWPLIWKSLKPAAFRGPRGIAPTEETA